MEKLKQKLQLLAIFSIFFIYKTISAQTLEEFTLWFMITVVYLTSLLIAYIALRGSQKTPMNPKGLMKKEE